MNYEKAYKEALAKAKNCLKDGTITNTAIDYISTIFPELKESEDEKIRKALVRFHKSTIDVDGIKGEEIVAWLEKQNEQKPIMNVPSREVILSIWDLGNEWKELTNGSISTEYGTQLDYIQKHWSESEYYLREKQGEQKPTWNVEDSSKVQRICQYLNEAKKYYADITEVRECMDWLKSLEYRVQPKPTEWSDEDEEYLRRAINATKDGYPMTTKWLKSLKERLS